MSKLDRWIDNRSVQNVFVWLFVFVLFIGVIQAENRILTSISIILLLAPAIYINNFLILPLFNKKNVLFALFFIVNAAVFTGIALFLLTYELDEKVEFGMFLNLLGIFVLALIFGSALRIARDSFVRRQEAKNAELKLLKAQLNPHFLFNTLNNLYGLSVIKSDKLPNLMLKLSDLLRYSLYDTKETFVALEKELQYLENYIALERIRLEDRTEIGFERSGDIAGKQIAPMLLIVFVENAFKHLGTALGKKSKVMIRVTAKNDSLEFCCCNSIDNQERESNLEKGKSGIGLQNAKKRLLFLYPNKHTLSINNDGEQYITELNLEI